MKHGFCLPFLALMLSAPRLHAEFVLYQLGDDGKETPVVNRVVMSDTTAGDASEVRFRLRNTGAKNGFVNSTYVRGAGFTTSGTPSFPFLVVPGWLRIRTRWISDVFRPMAPARCALRSETQEGWRCA